MARVKIDYVFQSLTGDALDAASVYVYQRGTTTEVSAYTLEVGGTVLPQPLTTIDGHVDGWVAPGSYDIVASKPGYATVSQAWEAAVNFDESKIAPIAKLSLLALSATTPDRIAWEYPDGTDVVELWGERLPVGAAFETIFTDEFSILDAGWVSREPTGHTAVLSVSGGYLLSTGNGGYFKAASWGSTAYTDARESVRAVRVSSNLSWAPGPGFYVDNGPHWIGLVYGQFGAGVDQMRLRIFEPNGAGGTTYRDVYSINSANQLTSYFRLTKAGATFTLERFADPKNPVANPGVAANESGSFTLAGADAVTYGGFGVPALMADSGGGFGGTEVDRFALERKTNEQRLLRAAITDPGGVRTVRSILWTDGSIVRSGLPLDAAPYTTVTIPDPTTAPVGRIIFITDAVAGQRLRVNNGSAWEIV